jgi:hypothetical protein
MNNAGWTPMNIGAWVLLLLLIIAAGTAVWLIVRLRGRRVTDPVCGRCGYAVRGLPTFTCPECGADLREVGILTPRRGGPPSANPGTKTETGTSVG